ncbi:MAG: FkbM family methyltransferase [Pseudonocardia sp.]
MTVGVVRIRHLVSRVGWFEAGYLRKVTRIMGLYRLSFWLLVRVGRQFGGIRPRRITRWLGRKAFAAGPSVAPTTWWTDRWGSQLLLNPFYFLDANIIAFGCHDPSMHRFIENHVKPGMTCFDVGANVGVVALHLARRVGLSGSVHAFEPVSSIRRRLTENTERNGLSTTVKIHPAALSNGSGRAVMAVADETATNQGQASLVNSDNPQLVISTEITTITIDEFVESNGVDRLDFLKVDIQGAELLLLEGGSRVFTELSPQILMEVSPEDLGGMGKNSRDLLEAVEAYGYRIYELDSRGWPGRPVHAQDVPADYYAANVVCIKDRSGPQPP